jgi:hypothetical protein
MQYMPLSKQLSIDGLSTISYLALMDMLDSLLVYQYKGYT